MGAMLCEILDGERPFVSETPIAVLLKHLQDPAPSILEARPDLPPAVGQVIARVLVKDPAERYASAGELARAFRAALMQRPDAADPQPVADTEPVVVARAKRDTDQEGL